MRIAYFMNSYPMTSTTFIRREIKAVEAQGVMVQRYAIRTWSEALVDPEDLEEQRNTRYLLTGNLAGLFAGFLAEVLTNPRGMGRALLALTRLMRNARGDVIRHLAYIAEAVALARNLRRDGIDHVHVHFSTNAAAVALMACRIGGGSYSFTAHGPDEFDNRVGSSLAMKISEAAFVVAISNYCRSQLLRAGGFAAWSKLHVIRCGVELDDSVDPVIPEDQEKQLFVSIGRLCPQKAQALLITATAQVVKEYPEVRVVLVGDGESRAEIEGIIAEHSLERHVHLAGWQPGPEVTRILRRARALILPSLAEGLPIVIMEAFSWRIPTVSTYIAGIPELLDERCGWIIPAGSISDIAEAMTSVLRASESDLRMLGEEGRRRVEIDHDLRKNTLELVRLFRSSH